MPSFPLTDSEAVNLRDYVMLAFRDDRVPKAAQIGPGRQPRSRSSGRTALLGKIPCFTCKPAGRRWDQTDGCMEALEPRVDGADGLNPQAFDPATLMPNLGVQDARLSPRSLSEQVSRQMTAQAGAGQRACPSSSRQARQ